jgi:putative oxidoreductase
MESLLTLYYQFKQQLYQIVKHVDGIPALALRIYLVPIFWMAGTKKIDLSTLMPYQNTVDWFGNPEWGLGLPLPALMAFMAGWTELLGAIFLAVGILVRWISIPLLVTMAVAAFSAHWVNGWQAIADPGAPFANERVMESAERLAAAKDILREHGNYSWITARGSLVVLNNGIEFATSYFVMLLALLALGGGRYVSLDYWLDRWFGRR